MDLNSLFFFSSRRRHTIYWRDWSSDVCSSDLIVKQTWSITEIYQKIKKGDLILDPEYQRNEVWHVSKRISFSESLFMKIMIPPIYVVEVPGTDILEGDRKSVV